MDIFADIDEGLSALKDSAPTLIADVPALAPLVPFLPLLGLAMNAVSTVQGATGSSLQAAVQAVAQHLTPGQPAAAALSQTAVSDGTTTAQITAVAAAVAAPTADAVQAAVTTAVAVLPGGNGSS